MNTTTNDLNEFLTILNDMGEKKVTGVKITAVCNAGHEMAGMVVSTRPLGGANPATSYVQAIETAKKVYEGVGFHVTEISYDVDNLSFIENALDISVEDINITGLSDLEINKIERRMTINLNHNHFYVKSTVATTTWKKA